MPYLTCIKEQKKQAASIGDENKANYLCCGESRFNVAKKIAEKMMKKYSY